jgi:hypothetical protein
VTSSSHAAGKGVGAVLLLSALAVHSLVETAALGVQSTAKSAYLIAASIGNTNQERGGGRAA